MNETAIAANSILTLVLKVLQNLLNIIFYSCTIHSHEDIKTLREKNTKGNTEKYKIKSILFDFVIKSIYVNKEMF